MVSSWLYSRRSAKLFGSTGHYFSTNAGVGKHHYYLFFEVGTFNSILLLLFYFSALLILLIYFNMKMELVFSNSQWSFIVQGVFNVFIFQGEGAAHRVYKYIGNDESFQGFVLRVPKVDILYIFHQKVCSVPSDDEQIANAEMINLLGASRVYVPRTYRLSMFH